MTEFMLGVTGRQTYGGELPSDPLRLWVSGSAHGGQVSFYDPRGLQPHQLALALDLEVRTPGRRRRRPGALVIAAPSGASDYLDPHGLAWFEDGSTQYLVAHYGSRPVLLDGVALTPLSSGILPPQDTQAVQGSYLQGVTRRPALFYACVSGPRQELDILYWDGATFTNVGLTYYPRCLTWWQNRLWMGYEESIRWSDVGDGGGYLLPSAGAIDVDLDIGDEIMSLIPIRSIEPYLLVFMRRRIYVFQVLVTATGLDFANSYLKPITYETGTVATRSVAHLGEYTLFLAADGVRTIARALDDTAAGTRAPISRPIEDWIERINWNYADRSSAVTFGSQYYLAVPLDGAQRPTHIFNFDSDVQAWSVWSAKAEPLAISAFHHRPSIWYLRSEAVLEDSVTACHVYEIDATADTEGSQSISTEEQSPAITLDLPEVDKEWRWIELDYQNIGGATATMTIEASVDEGSWITIGTIVVAASLIHLPAFLPWQFGIAPRASSKFTLTDMPIGRQIQFRFTETGSGRFTLLAYRMAAYLRAVRYS